MNQCSSLVSPDYNVIKVSSKLKVDVEVNVSKSVLEAAIGSGNPHTKYCRLGLTFRRPVDIVKHLVGEIFKLLLLTLFLKQQKRKYHRTTN